mmetsp:Transcript_15600/g.35712  ORF Transcript_15600/g.35712 Transcript_15600/m.35712 type:complete len:202 (-) Transcript_15600:667-1272(-)
MVNPEGHQHQLEVLLCCSHGLVQRLKDVARDFGRVLVPHCHQNFSHPVALAKKRLELGEVLAVVVGDHLLDSLGHVENFLLAQQVSSHPSQVKRVVEDSKVLPVPHLFPRLLLLGLLLPELRLPLCSVVRSSARLLLCGHAEAYQAPQLQSLDDTRQDGTQGCERSRTRFLRASTPLESLPQGLHEAAVARAAIFLLYRRQ